MGIVCNIHNIVCKTGVTNDQLQANGAKACGKGPSGTFILAASSAKRKKWSHRQVPGFWVMLWIFQTFNLVAMCRPLKICTIQLHLKITIAVYSGNRPNFSNNPTA